MSIKLFKNWWLLGLKGLILLGLGIFTLFNPATAAGLLATYLGIAIILSGISEIALALTNRDQAEWGSFLAEGVLNLVIGIIFLSRPEAANIIPILLGIWVLFSGVYLFARSMRGQVEGNYLIPSILMLILGAVLIFNPFSAYLSLMILVGIALLIGGLVVMFVSWKLRGVHRKLERTAESIADRLQDRS